MSLIMNESNFQHILRVLNTNSVDGKVKIESLDEDPRRRPPLLEHRLQEG